MSKPYQIALVQSNIRQITDLRERDTVIRENLERSLEISYETIARGTAKIMLFPEFWLQGAFNYQWGVEEWIASSIDLYNGWEIQIMQERATKWGVYMAGNVYERIPDIPGRFFNTAFLIDPSGEIILRHRKHFGGNLSGLSMVSSPGDLYDEFVQLFGEDQLFPVVETPLGRIGMCVCYEVNFFEVARILALKGAELILHPTGEPHGQHRPFWEQARRTRAYENGVYWASANHGSISGSRMPEFRGRGYSELVGYDGTVITVADGPGEAVITGLIDIEALRWHRSQIFGNLLAQNRTELYREAYSRKEGLPLNVLREVPTDRRSGSRKVQEVIRRYQQEGIYVRPGLPSPEA